MSKNAFLHPLKIKRRNRPLKIAVVDLETHDWTKVVAVGFYDGMEFKTFSSISKFFEFILRSKRHRYFKIYAHNGGKFDFLPFIDECVDRSLHYTPLEIGSRIAQLKVFTGTHDIYFRDSVCLLQDSLANLTKAFGVAHAKKELDHKTVLFSLDNPEHVEYLRHDCIGLYEVLQKFFQSPNINQVKPKLTLSSTALAIQRTLMKKPIQMTNQAIQNFIRESYAGGRCEIFKHESYALRCYDLNSLYPFCMVNFPVPSEHLYSSRSYDEFGFHEVSVFVPSDCIPVLPTRYNNRLIFPSGEIRGVYFSEELKLAVNHGAKIITHYRGEAFRKDNDFFSEYIGNLYQLRNANRENALNLVAKLLMNGLYGKFAQREETRSLQYDDGTLQGAAFGNEETYKKFRLINVKERHRSPHMLVHIAAAVTAYGRIHLYRQGLERGNASYCDTDSVFTTETLPTSKELGAWKHEFDAEYSYFRLPKTYLCSTNKGQIIKAKGFPKEMREKWNLDQFKNSNLSAQIEKPNTFRSSILKNNVAFSKNMLKKSIISGYTKRKTLADGINTRPWELKNGVIR